MFSGDELLKKKLQFVCTSIQGRRQEIRIRGAKAQNTAIRGARAEKCIDFRCSLA
jgi:hypothetical protein